MDSGYPSRRSHRRSSRGSSRRTSRSARRRRKCSPGRRAARGRPRCVHPGGGAGAACDGDRHLRAGLRLMRLASDEYGYGLSYSEVANLARWLHHPCAVPRRHPRGVCRAARSATCCSRRTSVSSWRAAAETWRHVVKTGVELGIPVPALSSALAYHELAAARLPAKPDPGAARLLRRAYPTSGSTAKACSIRCGSSRPRRRTTRALRRRRKGSEGRNWSNLVTRRRF